MKINKIYNEDCLEGMKGIADGSIDMVLCDLPYGVVRCKWDTIIPFEPLWEQYRRVIKPNGAIVLTASQPFTSALVMSNPKMFKYCWVWDKVCSSGFLNAKKQPLRGVEDVVIFYMKQPTYNPVMQTRGVPRVKGGYCKGNGSEVYGDYTNVSSTNNTYYPRNIIKVSNSNHTNRLHPTQKPVALFEYLIKTYTNPGELVLDNCIGSGTTAIACMNTQRNFIGFEMDKGYYDIACNRIEKLKESGEF